jgi:phosphoribosylamine--glycine ligase
VLPLASAQDHKAVGDGDIGPNTGGMGAYSPAPVMTPALDSVILETILRPTVAAMAAEGAPFKGVLFAGLMITADGPKLLEYNVRFGDPECQVLMARLDSDLLPLLLAARNGSLDQVRPRWRDDAALCVVMAARGYPGAHERGSVIRGLDAAEHMPGITIFHAGTVLTGGEVRANGGRVLGVTATASDVAGAKTLAYGAIKEIDWAEGFFRGDIGWRAVDRER